MQARTIVSHIQGGCEIPGERLPHHLTYWDLIHYFARCGRATYPRWWRIEYLWLALCYTLFRGRSVRVDR